jgi:hypothetical protein
VRSAGHALRYSWTHCEMKHALCGQRLLACFKCLILCFFWREYREQGWRGFNSESKDPRRCRESSNAASKKCGVQAGSKPNCPALTSLYSIMNSVGVVTVGVVNIATHFTKPRKLRFSTKDLVMEPTSGMAVTVMRWLKWILENKFSRWISCVKRFPFSTCT